MKTIFVFLFLFLPLIIFTQQKGVTPIKSTDGSSQSGSTYAVVVGISDYQDEEIPDLRFADKDALAFAGFLQSPAGGSLDEDHLKVLINEKATQAQFAAALDWLWEVAGENDKAIIYFSGHGDVEKKSLTQPGFLLCWDAPSKIYMAGGAFPLSMMQEVISTISIQNKSKVIMIADACRAGKLSGSHVSGSQLTNSNLAKQYANEIKILSCQPDEYSIEGEQWGGGRGAFSYHLLDGLAGLADDNTDNAVNLKEIGRYLEDYVTEEVSPQSQNPMVIGNKTEKLTDVFPEVLAKLKEGKIGQSQLFTATESRGIEDDVLSAADTGIVEMYFAFKKALKDKEFLSPQHACADYYYEKLVAEPSLQRLHSSMRRNYAAALQDDAQQVMNDWMKNSVEQTIQAEASKTKDRLPKKVFTEKVKAFPRCLERAAELLGPEHYMYQTLQARKHFFKGYILTNSDRNPNKGLGEKALAQFRLALQWQSELPQAYWQMINVYGYNLLQPDSAAVYGQKAMELYPSWVEPYASLGFLYLNKYKQFDRAKTYLEQISRIDSNSIMASNYWGVFYAIQKKYDKAEKHYKKAIQLDSTFTRAYNNLGLLYYTTSRYDEAEKYFDKAIQLDSTDASFYSNLGNIYVETNRIKEAEKFYKKAILLDSVFTSPYNNLGLIYMDIGQFGEAEKYFKKTIQLDSTFSLVYNSLGLVYSKTQRYGEAEKYFKKTIQFDSTNASAYNNLGLVYYETQRYEEAERVYKTAIRFDSTRASSYTNLGNIYSDTKRFMEAEKFYKKGIQLDSTNAFPYINLGSIYSETQQYEEAEKYLKKAIQLDSTFWMSYANLGVMYQSLKRWNESETMMQKSIELAPPIGPLFALLGNAYTHLNRLDDAKIELDKAVDMSPNYPDAFIFLAQWTLKKNQPDQALKYLEKGLELGYSDYDELHANSEFEDLKDTEKWDELMEKYFPD